MYNGSLHLYRCLFTLLLSATISSKKKKKKALHQLPVLEVQFLIIFSCFSYASFIKNPKLKTDFFLLNECTALRYISPATGLVPKGLKLQAWDISTP